MQRIKEKIYAVIYWIILLIVFIICMAFSYFIYVTVGIPVEKETTKTIEIQELVNTTPVEQNFTKEMIVSTGVELKEQNFIPLLVPMEEELQEKIFIQCKEAGIAFTLVMAMIETESNFQPDVISKTDDYGLMQINSKNKNWLMEELGIIDFLDPEENVKAGLHIISMLAEKYEVSEALMAYNMGEAGAKKLWDQGIYENNYSKKILEKEIEYSEYLDNINMIGE